MAWRAGWHILVAVLSAREVGGAHIRLPSVYLPYFDFKVAFYFVSFPYVFFPQPCTSSSLSLASSLKLRKQQENSPPELSCPALPWIQNGRQPSTPARDRAAGAPRTTPQRTLSGACVPRPTARRSARLRPPRASTAATARPATAGRRPLCAPRRSCAQGRRRRWPPFPPDCSEPG